MSQIIQPIGEQPTTPGKTNTLEHPLRPASSIHQRENITTPAK
jgi:hypothetical protein